MTYRLTPQAEADVEAIGDYISEENPPAAGRLVQRFIRQWELLSTQPHLGMARDDISPGVRHLVMGQYVAFYRVKGNDVLIVRVLHGRRNITASDIETSAPDH